MQYKIAKVIAELYEQNHYLLEGTLLSKQERDYYESICPQMGEAVASGAVHSMAGFMQRYYDKDVIILLDEYDTPMQEAWLSGYWDEAVTFLLNDVDAPISSNLRYTSQEKKRIWRRRLQMPFCR